MRMALASVSIMAIAPLGTVASAQGGDRVASSALEWKEIVPGAHFGAAYGEWEKGAHGKFVRFAKGVQIPMHRHTNDYHAVTISGRLVNLFEGGRRVDIAPGDYFYMAAGRAHSHECMSEEGCLFYTYAGKSWDFVPYEAPATPAGEAGGGR